MARTPAGAATVPPEVAELLRTLCDGRPIVFFDLETTGTEKMLDRIVEIAAIAVPPEGPPRVFDRLVNPGVRIPSEASAVHGISDADVADAPTFRDLVPELLAFLGDADLAGYNVRAFDIPVLQKEFERAGATFSLERRRIVDMQTIFFKKEPRDLAAALRLFAGRDHGGAHAALADVVATAEVLAGQLRRYPDLPRTLDGLHEFSVPAEGRWVDPDKRFGWRDGEAVFAFGVHRGKSLALVAETKPEYLDWMIRGDFPEAAKEIARNARRGVFPKKRP
ncbi:MAG TPA: 3'-5' exonuclease [Thermoanaerobaculia bacterium]|nr:3'-5' exonuclease [Thermoanaerobaculia bacterium]HQR67531.1 3'-5' exonuclease [Thermoanaerobaculia bacterium]